MEYHMKELFEPNGKSRGWFVLDSGAMFALVLTRRRGKPKPRPMNSTKT